METEAALREIQTLCVYCGASSGRDGAFTDHARAFGAACAARGLGIVFGGGGVGLMGSVADAALAGGGRVVGVIPRSMESEVPATGLTELVVVDDMHTRKRKMFELADAFAALPGGLGTLDETIEVLTWRQLGLHDRPIVLANCGGYWDPLLSLIDHVVATGFAHGDTGDLYTVASSIGDVFDKLGV